MRHNRSLLKVLAVVQNFLPEHIPSQTVLGTRNTLQCLKRGKAVSATPEELVRQRIVRWLMVDKKWPKKKIKFERSYDWVGDPNRDRIRPDIELIGEDEETVVVVECKAPDTPLGPQVEKQAREYAIKTNSQYIWLSNGEQHKFLRRISKGRWEPSSSIEPLNAECDQRDYHFDVPSSDDSSVVDEYFEQNFYDYGFADLAQNERQIVLAVHRLLFQVQKKLPYSFNGVHVLEDLGPSRYVFGNASGGSWDGLYADFIAATSGRVEALSVSVYPWTWSPSEIRICVGVRKPGMHHHALQMNMKHSEWDKRKRCWRVFHDGRMSAAKNEDVLKSCEESGLGDLVQERENGREHLYLGDLHVAGNVTWNNSRNFLANLLHYGIIRTNLRDALRARRSRRRSR